MREIKFRGKTTSGEWIYGSLCTNPYDENDVEIVDHSKVFLPRESVLPETVGQCAGLEDSNGNDIYEGDIMKSAFSKNAFGVVAWRQQGYFCIIPIERLNDKYDEHSEYSTLGHMLEVRVEGTPCNFEVIGNIHDNPELIQQ